MRIRGNRGVVQPAQNMSTLFSVGGRPRGTAPNSRGGNSDALSTEVLAIHLRSLFGQGKKQQGPPGPELQPELWVVSLDEVERIVKDLPVFDDRNFDARRVRAEEDTQLVF